jgi:rhodanese-related sulfurtransferase
MDTSTIINLLFILAASWFIYTRFAPTRGLRTLRGKEFEQELQAKKNNMIIDVREPREYKNGFIPSAINIPLSQLKSKLNEIPKDKNIYLYCQSGMRSKQAARVLSKQKYNNLAHLQGGILAWAGPVRK